MENGQILLNEDAERIYNAVSDKYIDENGSLKFRYTFMEVCEIFDISQFELITIISNFNDN